MYIEKILMKLNMSFYIKDEELLEKFNKIWDKVKKEDLILNLYIMKNS